MDIVEEVSVINKRALGRIILKHCGNEGIEDDKIHENMRRLFQHVIDYLPKESDRVWNSAEISVFDQGGNSIFIRSGNSCNKFVVHNDGHNELEVINTQRESIFYRAYQWVMSWLPTINRDTQQY